MINTQRLQSISMSLASQNRETGPKCKFLNSEIVVGGSQKPSSDFGTKIIEIIYNADPAILYEFGLKESDTKIVSSGALAVFSGIKTGRSPSDKRIVYYPDDVSNIWWEDKVSPCIRMNPETFNINRETTICYLTIKDQLFVFDGFAGWDKEHRIKVRVICTRSYHALFMYNMLIRPNADELANYGEPDYTIYNAGVYPCNRFISDMSSSTTIDFDFKRKEILILGTQYAGEMKKGIFTVMHYIMPKIGLLSLHSSCNVSNDGSNVALFFGLSGTGKTTLSADPYRKLIGDDEHCWSDRGIFNIEGGCYAKCVNLKKEYEPDIWGAIKYGALLENVIFDNKTRVVNFDDISITENTRVSYPIEYINNAQIPCQCSHPNNIIFLSCDAFGVLPPVSLLNFEQAMYYFISGYTAKIPGTEMGIVEPVPTFSACFGEAFLVAHPKVYANLLREKMSKYQTKVWLINTGWIKGSYGSAKGRRCPLKYTRKIIDNIHNGSIMSEQSTKLPIFGLDYFNKIADIPEEIINPLKGWSDKDLYHKKLAELGDKFIKNFKKYNLPDLEQLGPSSAATPMVDPPMN